MIAPSFAGALALGPTEAVAWALQVVLALWLLARGARGGPLPPLSTPVCVLVIAGGWIWRLAYGFALEADDFFFWIGDDPYRFARAFEWSRAPVAAFGNDPWIAGSYYLHGSAMAWLGGDAIHASKLVSASHAVLPLIGVCLFAAAVFGRREVAAAAVLLVTPAWIQVLLETGLMTELPVTGLLLSGTACWLFAWREAPGRGRNAWHLGGALAFAAATSLHLVAWIHLAVILAGFLAARLAGSRPARLCEFVWVAAVSGAFCACWLAIQWRMSGSPWAQLAFAGADDTPFKLGGSTLERAGIYPLSLAFCLRIWLPWAAFGVGRALHRGDATARAVLAGVGAVLAVLTVTACVGGTNLTPFRSVMPLATALLAYAAAALFAPDAPGATDAAGPRPRRWPRPAIAVAATVLTLAFADAHTRIFQHRIVDSVMWDRESPRAVPGSLFALGRWLREEIPRRAADAPDGSPFPPVRVAAFPGNRIGWSLLLHATGEPSWLERARPGHLLDGLHPGQLLVATRALPEAGPTPLVPVATIGPYHVYQTPGAPTP